MAEVMPEREPERWDDRTRRLLGDDSMERLAAARVLVVGVGGVGGYAAEMLARSGVGSLTLVDADEVAVSNLNRQLIALRSTVGESKTALFAERFADINPEIRVESIQAFMDEENVGEMLDGGYDFVLDCIDTVAPKVALLLGCADRRIPVISSMGAGGRCDPTKIGYFSLWETREDGLARAVRQRMKRLGRRPQIKVVASTETPSSASLVEVGTRSKRTSYGTLATIPAIFGIMMANHAILKLVDRS